MNNISEFNKCANCGSCYNACPKNAISVQSDDLFYTLSVNEDKCTACGICKSVCPVNLPQEAQTIRSAYAVVHDNEQVVKESSSGGFFQRWPSGSSNAAELFLERLLRTNAPVLKSLPPKTARWTICAEASMSKVKSGIHSEKSSLC